jgi:pimeloyl-ACP methyl ester carboxylesterase
MQFPELNYPIKNYIISLKSGYSLSFFDEGKGENTLLFIHGLGAYGQGWIKNFWVLRDNFRCLVPDLPGYGKSSAGIHSGKMSFYSAIMKELLDELGIKKISLAGHSMGGQIAITLALTFPDIIDRLFLLSPAGIETFTEPETAWIKKNFTAGSYGSANEEQVRLSYLNNFFNMPYDAEYMIRDRMIMKNSANFASHCEVVANSLYGMLDEPVFNKLGKICCPTDIIWGTNDKLIPHPLLHPGKIPTGMADIAAKEIHGSKLHLINECGHFIPFEKPAEVNTIILKAFGLI